MSPGRFTASLAELGFPRVSGDEPEGLQGLGVGTEFSPRERG